MELIYVKNVMSLTPSTASPLNDLGPNITYREVGRVDVQRPMRHPEVHSPCPEQHGGSHFFGVPAIQTVEHRHKTCQLGG